MGPRMLGPMYAIFLLLLLPSPLLTTRSTPDPYLTQDQGHHPSSRLQESPADGESCWSTYDLYFVLDSSHSVNNNWMFTQSFVQDLVNRFKNPKQRISFITYSTHGRINMKLTSDREQISNSVIELLNVLPTGAINMQHGLEKANEQIERTRAAGAEVPSLIIVLTGGELLPESFAETKVEAAKSKQLGASLFFVGVQNHQKYQLLEIAGEEDHVFGVDSGYPGLEDIVDPLIARSCVQITSVDFSRICSRGIKAVSVQDTSITCPGLKMNNRGWAIFIDISLNNGLTFIKTDLDVSRRNCVTSRKGSPPALLGAIPPAAQQRALPDAVPEDTQDIYPDEGSSSPVFPSFNTLFWAVPLLVLPFILLLCWCIWRWYPKSSPAPLAQKCPMVIVSCCGNHDKEKIEERERCHSAVPLMMPHCGSLSCGMWISHQPNCHCCHHEPGCPTQLLPAE
ncbi:anthrax toxin receptor-like isoform X2 [Manis pentadactyla]|uniref:anthrax toxin receptor-like isoform X2 n=1 Tax=Manis pentadactyla TaxID=143292 RepID=UPI00255CE852|nr:anthrax toxin receptor-like isoform X2 [Manis pentadactyla]